MREVPLLGVAHHAGAVVRVVHPAQLEVACHDRVLDVVHRVGNVVGQVHDLGLEAGPPRRGAFPDPVEDGEVVLVGAELAGALPVDHRGVQRGPRVFRRRVQAGAREVQSCGAAVTGQHLGLQARQQAECLGVPFEPADGMCHLVEGGLAVVSERRVPQVVAQARGVHHIRIAAQRTAQFPAHLRHFEAVGQAGADEVVGVRSHHLGLCAKPAERRGMQHAGAVTLKVGPVGALGRLLHPAGGVLGLVAGQDRRCGARFSHRKHPAPRRRCPWTVHRSGPGIPASLSAARASWASRRGRAGLRRPRRGTANPGPAG